MKFDVALIREIAERVVSSEGLELVDVELKGSASNQLLRIFIHKPGGIDHGDCRLISEQMSAILDVEDPFPGKYVLEVSSPGLDRPLKNAADFRRCQGRRASITLLEPLAGQLSFEGRLMGFEEGRVRVEIAGKEVLELDHENIARAKLVIKF